MRSVLVTGASRGIERSIVGHLALPGWDVVAGVRTEQDATMIAATNPRISSVLLDVTDTAQLAALNNSPPDRLDAVSTRGHFLPGPIEGARAADQLRRQNLGEPWISQAGPRRRPGLRGAGSPTRMGYTDRCP
jgi:NADP-dependent 3-hydroxy acid dehydrogenase YdfG